MTFFLNSFILSGRFFSILSVFFPGLIFSNCMSSLIKDRKLLLIFCLGLLLRVLFLEWGAQRYFGVSQEAIFYNGDSNSFILSFRNWWHLGHYTFDFQQPDASFGRLPGYPFFYGLHYLLAGPVHALRAVAITQVLLDSCSALLVFSSVRRLVGLSWLAVKPKEWAPYIGALLYATYPFTIVWVPIIGTETLATFLSLAWLAWLLRPTRTVGHFVGLGLLLVAAFYVREYLGILLPITCAYLLAGQPPASSAIRKWQAILLVCGTFGALYMLWPIRNYVVAQRFIPLKPVTAGYANFNIDKVSARDWVLCWTSDDQTWLKKITNSRTVAFPAEVFATPQEAKLARRAAQLAHDCGSSFYLDRQWQVPDTLLSAVGQATSAAAPLAVTQYNCNPEISALFTHLKASYVARHPVRYWLGVPSQNLAKAFFKSTTASTLGQPAGVRAWLTRGVFAWRSMLLLLGCAGLVYYRRHRQVWPVAVFALFMYLFISFLARRLEMRYLLQADVLLLIPAALLLGVVAGWWWPQQPAAGKTGPHG